MATRIFSSETWRKIGQPDLNSKMFYVIKATGEKVYGQVTAIQFGHKRGVKITIKKFK